MSSQESRFYQLVEGHIQSLKSRQDKFSISKELYAKIRAALSLPRGEKCEDGGQFKSWCRANFFLGAAPGNLVLCAKTKYPVVTKEDLYAAIKKCHDHVGHSGKRTWDEVRSKHAGVKYTAIDFFIKTCPPCLERQSAVFKNVLPPAARPKVSPGFLLRLQIDLIDFGGRPTSGGFQWILHAWDHFTGFSWCYPLRNKCAEEVAVKLLGQLCVFGPPRMMQCNEGREFAGLVIQKLVSLWPGIVIIRGCPSTSEPPQDWAARGHGNLQDRLEQWMKENGPNWSRGLPLITHALNTAVSGATGKSPYQLVFGQTPNSECSLWKELARQGVADEEDIPAGVLNPADCSDPNPNAAGNGEPPSASTEHQSGSGGGGGGAALTENPSDCAAASEAADNGVFHEGSVTSESEDEEEDEDEEEEPPQHQTVSEKKTQTERASDEGGNPSGSGRVLRQRLESSGQGSSGKRVTHKRGKEFLLLSDGGVIVALGYEVKNKRVLRGKRVHTKTHAVIAIEEVFNCACVPQEGNPNEEPLRGGQIVLWKHTRLVKHDRLSPMNVKVRT